jgi:mRNA-decapping enzyme 1B
MAQKPQDEELKRINLQNLKKQEDKSITDILGTASHTTLYRFDNNSCQWDRVGVEGTTFIVTADTVPSARLIVLNKLGKYMYIGDIDD